jgi:hypothetical protein
MPNCNRIPPPQQSRTAATTHLPPPQYPCPAPYQQLVVIPAVQQHPNVWTDDSPPELNLVSQDRSGELQLDHGASPPPAALIMAQAAIQTPIVPIDPITAYINLGISAGEWITLQEGITSIPHIPHQACEEWKSCFLTVIRKAIAKHDTERRESAFNLLLLLPALLLTPGPRKKRQPFLREVVKRRCRLFLQGQLEELIREKERRPADGRRALPSEPRRTRTCYCGGQHTQRSRALQARFQDRSASQRWPVWQGAQPAFVSRYC